MIIENIKKARRTSRRFSEIMKPTKLIIFSLIFLMYVNYVSAASIGISPGRVKFENVLKGEKGSYSERIITISTGSDEELIAKKYTKSLTGKQPWFTPRGVKIDIYTRDIPGVSLEAIVKHSKEFPVGNKGSIRVLGLEPLVVAKHTAQRDQDVEDLQSIAKSKLKEIDWNVVQSITGDKYKTELMKKDLEFLAKSDR